MCWPTGPMRAASTATCVGSATKSELWGEQVFFGKGQCANCHTPPFYLDHQMYDLHLERFLKDEPGDGPIKTFTLRGIKDSSP